MTELEALDVLMVLRAGLPSAYLKLTEADTAAMVALWAELFAEYPGPMVAAAAKTYIWNDQSGRFPAPGAIRTEIEDIQRVVIQCSFGSTVQEYMGASAQKFPPSVRAYIDGEARRKFQEIYGRPFVSQAEKIAASRMRALAEGG